MTNLLNVGIDKEGGLIKQPLTINVEEVFVHGFYEIHGFTEEVYTSFLHLSEEEFTSAKKVGSKEHVEKMNVEFYANLARIEEDKNRLLECKIRRENRHKPRKRTKR